MTQGIARAQDDALLASLLKELGQEATRYRFAVAPNPCVGAAVLAGSRVVARGFHRLWGGAHAEVAALDNAAKSDVPRSEWDTLVVTLEPCSSRGKTAACVEAIRAAGIGRVVVGAEDPDPRHRGRGLKILREAGIEVLSIAGASELVDVAPHFLLWSDADRIRRPRPWTIAKWAQTRSGQLSPPEDVGEGRWISGAESRAEVHRLRSSVDAIVTGVGTVLSDDPRLSVRLVEADRRTACPGTAPLRVVLDTYLRMPTDAALFAPTSSEEAAGRVHLLCQPAPASERYQALEEAGAEVHGLRVDMNDSVALREVQNWLWSRGVRRLLLESGPTLLMGYFERGFIDQIRVYTGEVNGGRGPSLAKALAAADLRQREDREVGRDAVLEAFVGSSE